MAAIETNIHKSDEELLGLLRQYVQTKALPPWLKPRHSFSVTSVGRGDNDQCAGSLKWLVTFSPPIPFREVFVILALFLPQLFTEGARTSHCLWSSPEVQRNEYYVQILVQGMHEFHITFPNWSNAAAFCLPPLHGLEFGQLTQRPFAPPQAVRWGSVPYDPARRHPSN